MFLVKKLTPEEERLRLERNRAYSVRICRKYDAIDKTGLNPIDRLGLAACRLNSWEWDEILGPKPEGFDDLEIADRFYEERIHHPFLMRILEKLDPQTYKKGRYKKDYIAPALKAIRSIIGEANISRCWWRFNLGRTEEEWLHWYCTERFSDHRDAGCGRS